MNNKKNIVALVLMLIASILVTTNYITARGGHGGGRGHGGRGWYGGGFGLGFGLGLGWPYYGYSYGWPYYGYGYGAPYGYGYDPYYRPYRPYDRSYYGAASDNYERDRLYEYEKGRKDEREAQLRAQQKKQLKE